MRQLVYYVAMSIDGYIADVDGDFSCFPTDPATLQVLFERYPETCPAHVRNALGVPSAAHRFDTVLMGFRTYQPAAHAGLPGGAYPHLRQIVATHRDLSSASGLETLQGDLTETVAALKQENGADIWLCGGGNLASQLVDVIDEIQLKVNPIVLGRGIPVLPSQRTQTRFRHATAETLPGGVCLLTYSASGDVADPGHPL